MKRRKPGEITPLHFAARDGETEMVEFLLARGVDVNAATDHGWTPLHFAAAQGHTFVTQLLLDKKANATAKTDEGHTPLDLAVLRSQATVAELLRRHCDRARSGTVGHDTRRAARRPKPKSH
jgi:ankyrin repeat protein